MERKIIFEETYQYLGDTNKLVEMKNTDGTVQKTKYHKNGKVSELELYSNSDVIAIRKFDENGKVKYYESDYGVTNYEYEYFDKEKTLVSVIKVNDELVKKCSLINGKPYIVYRATKNGNYMNISTYEYNDKGLCVKVVLSNNNPSSSQKTIIEYEYDDSDRIILHKNYIMRFDEIIKSTTRRYTYGNQFMNVYDDDENLIESYIYDNNKVVVAYCLDKIEHHIYDDKGRLILSRSNHGDVYKCEYDDYGNCIYRINDDTAVEEFYDYKYYNEHCRVLHLKTIDRSNADEEYVIEKWNEYDDSGKIKSTREFYTGKDIVITVYEYDELGRQTRLYKYIEEQN